MLTSNPFTEHWCRNLIVLPSKSFTEKVIKIVARVSLTLVNLVLKSDTSFAVRGGPEMPSENASCSQSAILARSKSLGAAQELRSKRETRPAVII